MFELEPKTTDLHSFFFEYGGKLYGTDGSQNLSVDASGILPSVNESASVGIRKYIKTLFTVKHLKKLKVIDLGAGVGFLQKALDEDDFFEAYSFEGAEELLKNIVCNNKKVAVCDLSIPITDTRLHKAFNLSTSFEFLEHIHRDHQKPVWDNIEYISDFHLCSIHVANKEHRLHCTIMKPEEWENFFVKRNIWYQKLGEYPINPDVSKEIFRESTGLYGWDCSVMYLLRFV